MHKSIFFNARHGKLRGIYGLTQLQKLYFIIGLFYFTFPYPIGFHNRPNIMYYLYSASVLSFILVNQILTNIYKINIEKQWGARLMPYACLTGTELSFFHVVPIDCAPIETVDLETVQHICIKCPLYSSLAYSIDIQYRDGNVKTYKVDLDVPFNLEVEDLEAALKQHGVAFTFMRKYFFTKTQLPLK